MWMPWKNLCAPGPTPAPRPARRVVPRLVPLEDRLAPATFAVTTRFDVVDPADGKLSLREAVSRANANPGPDTITLPAGTYRIQLPAHESFNAAGDFNIIDSVTIRGAGAAATVVDGQRLDRVFDVYGLGGPSSIKVTFQGLTIRGGLNNDYIGGAGILVGNADLVVRGCVITDNRTALKGGGISNAYVPGTGHVTLVRTTVSRNVADGNGGGLYVAGDVDGLGSTLTVKSSTVRHNVAGDNGGGIYAGMATLTGCTVSGNFAADDGGGILAGSFGANLTGCTVSGNFAAGDGGGIRAFTATLTNSTVSGNHASRNGGGIRAFGPVSLVHVTITDNSAYAGGGVYRHPTASGSATVKNSIIAGNLAAFGGAPDVAGDFTSLGHNLIGIGDGSTGFGASGDQVGTAAVPIDPKLGVLRNNGGRTQTHALLAGSPAIDQGDSTGAPATDQRGVHRPRDGDRNGTDVVDIGAFEK